LFIGGCFLLLLNGQVFTNAIVFLGFAVTSSVLWLPIIFRSKHNDHRRIAAWIFLGHLAVMIAFATGLPDKYDWQQKFNNAGNELREPGRNSVNE
jgi:uncharacterized membrane protein